MDKPRMVTLDRDTMSGYLLNVLGTDQIHDFGGYRLADDNKNIIKLFLKETSLNNSKKSNQLKNGKNQNITGGFPILIDLPTDSEFIEQQCLEIINIFVNTIIDENNYSDLIVTGGEDTPIQQQQFSNDKFEELNKSPNSVTDLENIQSEPDMNSNLNSVKNNLFDNSDNDSPDNKYTESKPNHDNSTNDNVLKDNFLNIMEWGTHVKTNIKSFVDTSNNNINDYLNYICIDDVINIFTSYLDKLSKINKSEDVINFEYFNTLYVESMNYFISLISCSNNIQKGGENKPKKSFKSVISNMLKQMAFTFCNITDKYNCDDWENSRNWECFEIGLLNNNNSSVEKYSSDWIRENIISNKPKVLNEEEQPIKKKKLDNIVPDIKPLEGVFDVIGNLNCKLNLKTQKRHIINNYANLDESWKELVLNNYPSFIDSQPSGGKEDELLENMEKYNCGFQDPSGNEYYKIIMTTLFKKHTISIKCDNNKFEFTQTFSNFKTYNKDTKKIQYATRWKDVTLCVALINALESISSVLKIKKITSLIDLIEIIEKSFTNKVNIIEIFYKFSLFKGLGDISQEMTSVIKYGGGNTNSLSTTNKDKYEAFDASGNALRLFLAGDILSANRFILTLNSGLKYENNNINLKAYGGYLRVYGCKPTDMYLIDQYKKPSTWGGKPKHSRKYKNSKRKRKNHTKNKRNKHYKTYKLYKKNA
jgi:hypothetical protein